MIKYDDVIESDCRGEKKANQLLAYTLLKLLHRNLKFYSLSWWQLMPSVIWPKFLSYV